MLRKFQLAVSATVLLALVAAGCAKTDQVASSPADTAAVEQTVRESIAAENAQDATAFTGLWTDKGLKQYDVGTREDLTSGKSPGFGEDKVQIVEFDTTSVTGDTAVATVDAAPEAATVAKVLYRLKFKLIKRDRWLLDGFSFAGSPPAPPKAPIVTVNALDYAFGVSPAEAPGDFAIKFSNQGKEAHELTLFKAPDSADFMTAKAAVENLDGHELDQVPSGYAADHLSFVEPGKSQGVAFAEPLEKGNYLFVCYLPKGGLTQEGEPKVAGAAPHVQIGMISQFKVI